jgi:hypothetical protein
MLVTMKNAIFWDLMQRVALVRSDVSEKRIASVIRVEEINKLGTMLAVTSNVAQKCWFQRATQHYIPEDGVLHKLVASCSSASVRKEAACAFSMLFAFHCILDSIPHKTKAIFSIWISS